MTDFILTDMDVVTFLPVFTGAVTIPIPGILKGSSNVRIGGKFIALENDEKSVQIPGVPYTQSAYVIPGAGVLKISSLSGNQKTTKVRCNGKPLLLKGSQFSAAFEVIVSAQTPPPISSTDTVPNYTGNGVFINTNVTVRAT